MTAEARWATPEAAVLTAVVATETTVPHPHKLARTIIERAAVRVVVFMSAK
jgi:hypothetical protein